MCEWYSPLIVLTTITKTLANDRRIRSTSGYVAVTDVERLNGDFARNQTTRKPENTVVDSTIQSDMKLRPFTVTSGAGDGKRRNDTCCSDSQRQATKDTESISILTIKDGMFEMKGDTHLSREDFDDSIVNFCKQGFKRKNRGKDLAGKHRAIRCLQSPWVITRRTVSSFTHATIKIDSLFDGDFSLSFSTPQTKFYSPQVPFSRQAHPQLSGRPSTRPQPRLRYDDEYEHD